MELDRFVNEYISAYICEEKDLSDSNFINEINKRRTFAIISHPDAGKTTMTEKLLLHGNAIQVAGAVKAKRDGRRATSDWMSMEQERGISVTTAMMQFPYRDRMVNLLDTPGHEDFSEDTYRTLTAVDSVLMVIDGAKGVEDRTVKLMEVCRMRDTPILTFINKLDRDIRNPIEVLDEIESVLKISCAPINWPLGMGKLFKGICNLQTGLVHVYQQGLGSTVADDVCIEEGMQSSAARELLGAYYEDVQEEIELVRGATHKFDLQAYLSGTMTPVFFGTALGNFGVREMLDDFVEWAPPPKPRESSERLVEPHEDRFSGFVFKIQANMDPRHRDRIAFLRICSGTYRKGMKVHQVRTGKDLKIADAVTFMAGERAAVVEATAGDIIGLHNHGSMQIGDSFTEGEKVRFIGIPNFAPELFRRIRLEEPLKMKQLRKGLQQLSEEGSVQVFFPEHNSDIIVGAVGILQFEVVAFRLQDEYKVEATYEPINTYTARWLELPDNGIEAEFRRKAGESLALDGSGHLAYLASSRVNLSLMEERYPNVIFRTTREH